MSFLPHPEFGKCRLRVLGRDFSSRSHDLLDRAGVDSEEEEEEEDLVRLDQ